MFTEEETKELIASYSKIKYVLLSRQDNILSKIV